MNRRLARTAAVLATTGVLVALGLAWYSTRSGPSDQRPVVMPPTFAELALEPNNFAASGDWAGFAREDTDGAPVAGASYGTIRTRFVNVVAARADLTGKQDVRMAGDEGRLIGNTRCTEAVVMRAENQDDTPAAQLTPLTGKLLCWRTSPQLSVTAFALAEPPAAEQLAAAVDQLWTSLR